MATSKLAQQHGQEVSFPVSLEVEVCQGCGAVFAVPVGVMRRHDERGMSLRCINPKCPWPSYSRTETENAKQIRLLKEEKRRLARRLSFESDAKRIAQQKRRAAELSRAAIKGHLTRTKKRIAAGVCPCCKRTFQDLARHMSGQHPTYAAPKETP